MVDKEKIHQYLTRKPRTMYYNSIYSQLCNFIPRYRFEKIVKKSGECNIKSPDNLN